MKKLKDVYEHEQKQCEENSKYGMACHDLIADSEQAATDEDNKSKAKRIKETSYGR